MADSISKERAIRGIVSSAVKSYANGFSTRHLTEVDDENRAINVKIHNVFIASLGPEIQYYSALARSLDSSLRNMLESMAISIAALNYEVSQHAEGTLYKEQTDYIAELLEQYKRSINRRSPKHWTQGSVRLFFAEEELFFSRDFWNLVCKSDDGYDIVIDEYKKNAHYLYAAWSEVFPSKRKKQCRA